MANKEKQPISKKARVFLSALALSGALAACRDQDQQVSPLETPRTSPTSTPTTEIANPTATVELSPTIPPTIAPTETPEPTPEKEIVHVSGTTIDEGYLRNAFAGIGGGEVVENGQQETTVVEFGQGYVSQSWGEQIDFTSLSEDPVASLKYLISLGAYQGAEGIFSPGGRGEEAIFPRLADLSLFRITLANVPSKEIQVTQEYREGTIPQNFKLYPETQMTVVGLFRPAGEQVDYALVAFTDYLRVSKESGVPRHYLAILPTHFPDDPENRNTLSLANRLEANGYSFNPETKEIIITDQAGQVVALELNRIEGEELVQDLRKACGLYFVDQINGEQVENPVVPYPDQMPTYWAMIERRDEEGNIGLFLYGAEEKETEMQEVARAGYNHEKEEWYWQESGYLEAEFFMSQEEEEELRVNIANLSSSMVGGEGSVEDILRYLEEIKKYHGSDDWMDQSSQYMAYLGAVGSLKGEYYASGGSPETRNSEILEVLAQFREMARKNPYFHEEDWEVAGIENY